VDTKYQKLGYAVRFLVGGFGAVLLVLFALSAYGTWAINGKYFHYYGFPRIGWSDLLWLIVASYFLLVGCIGTWRLVRR
jgi:hypothetical protein